MDKQEKNKKPARLAEQAKQVADDQAGDEELARLKKDFEELKLKFDGMTDQLKRAVADYHNLEKRVAEGRLELSRWATGELIKKILPVIDNMERALKGAGEEEKASGWFKGVEMSVRQLLSVLKDEGLEEIVDNDQFDPALHEAVDTREGDDNKILEVLEKGYRLNGKVLKVAKVVVGKTGG